MTGPADTAAGRIRAFLDARPERDDYESSDIILTEPDPNPGPGRRWLHLTRADLRAVLDEREQLAARVAELEATIKRSRADNRDLHRRLMAEGDVLTPETIVMIQEGVAEAERGETKNLGSFAQYLTTPDGQDVETDGSAR